MLTDLQPIYPIAVTLGLMLGIPVLTFLQETTQGQIQRTLGQRVFMALSVPGVIAHELSHAIINVLFGHKIDKIGWFAPHPGSRNRITLGYVHYRYDTRSPLQHLGVVVSSFAPALLCPLMISGLLSLTGRHDIGNPISIDSVWDFLAGTRNVRDIAITLLVFSIGLHSSPSLADYRGAESGLSLKALWGVLLAIGAGYLSWYLMTRWFELDGLTNWLQWWAYVLWQSWFQGVVFAAVSLALIYVPLQLEERLMSRSRS